MIEYKVLKELERNPDATQRTLAERLGVSLGKINYVLGGLAGKGIVKAQRLKNDSRAIRWNYLLTPKGVREKFRLTRAYLDKRIREFDEIQRDIAMLRKEVGERKRVKGEG
jgi:EPS-associated MarR family transcriptional regulator